MNIQVFIYMCSSPARSADVFVGMWICLGVRCVGWVAHADVGHFFARPGWLLSRSPAHGGDGLPGACDRSARKASHVRAVRLLASLMSFVRRPSLRS